MRLAILNLLKRKHSLIFQKLIIKYLEKHHFLISHILNAFPKITGKNIEIITDYFGNKKMKNGVIYVQ